MNAVLDIKNVSFVYPKSSNAALSAVNLSVEKGEIFGLLGPNGGGKTTLFKMISTLTQVQKGEILIFGQNIQNDISSVRQKMGVVFQYPALDKKLTVEENLKYQGYLYGLRGTILRQKIELCLGQVGLQDRAKSRVETLSGGLARRTEIAKALLNDPQLLMMDEPSTGLDPGARIDFWKQLKQLRQQGITIILTTHLMDEADQCDRLAILSQGKVVAQGAPQELKQKIGGEVLTLRAHNPQDLAQNIEKKFAKSVELFGMDLRLEMSQAHSFAVQLVESFPQQILSVTVSQPSLEDVFIHFTGHKFYETLGYEGKK